MLTAISPLDGRYNSKTQVLKDYWSEYALIKYRVLIEIKFLKALANEPNINEISSFNNNELKALDDLIKNFNETKAEKVKEIEKTTNHDVKAVEYFLKAELKDKIKENDLEFIHFACTSEDINNLAYGLMLKDGLKNVILPQIQNLTNIINQDAQIWKNISILARTHGQTASPTTLGKEFWVFSERLNRQLNLLISQDYLGKLNGATGNFNAHLVAYPQVNWQDFSAKFIKDLGLTPNFATTQIEPHDYNAEIFQNMMRINTILIDLCRDVWAYISIGYFKQKLQTGEIGSSTMPHKVNPIDFENAEGNLGLANAIFSHLSQKLPISRWQRDLTDSTVMRNVGTGFAYSLIAFNSLEKGLKKLEVNHLKINDDLNNAWEVLAEAIQTIMRKNKIEKPYEKLKDLTRGKQITAEIVRDFIHSLELAPADKELLLNLSPATYIGIANKLF